MEAAMNMMYPIARRCDARVEELRAEFGAILAERIIEAEAVDFLWEARVIEHYLGQHPVSEWLDDGAGDELSRVLVLSCLAGEWVMGLCLVDGEGHPVELVWKRNFGAEMAASEAFHRAS
jgi:hypothetical protein